MSQDRRGSAQERERKLAEARRRIWSNVRQVTSRGVRDWTVADCLQWLTRAGFDDFSLLFYHSGFCGYDLLNIDEHSFSKKSRLAPHRIAEFLSAVRQLRSDELVLPTEKEEIQTTPIDEPRRNPHTAAHPTAAAAAAAAAPARRALVRQARTITEDTYANMLPVLTPTTAKSLVEHSQNITVTVPGCSNPVALSSLKLTSLGDDYRLVVIRVDGPAESTTDPTPPAPPAAAAAAAAAATATTETTPGANQAAISATDGNPVKAVLDGEYSSRSTYTNDFNALTYQNAGPPLLHCPPPCRRSARGAKASVADDAVNCSPLCSPSVRGRDHQPHQPAQRRMGPGAGAVGGAGMSGGGGVAKGAGLGDLQSIYEEPTDAPSPATTAGTLTNTTYNSSNPGPDSSGPRGDRAPSTLSAVSVARPTTTTTSPQQQQQQQQQKRQSLEHQSSVGSATEHMYDSILTGYFRKKAAKIGQAHRRFFMLKDTKVDYFEHIGSFNVHPSTNVLVKGKELTVRNVDRTWNLTADETDDAEIWASRLQGAAIRAASGSVSGSSMVMRSGSALSVAACAPAPATAASPAAAAATALLSSSPPKADGGMAVVATHGDRQSCSAVSLYESLYDSLASTTRCRSNSLPSSACHEFYFQPWYHAHVTQRDAEKLLERFIVQYPTGLFLVRPQCQGHFTGAVISRTHLGKIYHLAVECREKLWCCSGLLLDTEFPSLCALIEELRVPRIPCSKRLMMFIDNLTLAVF